jgi:hypothetical protein
MGIRMEMEMEGKGMRRVLLRKRAGVGRGGVENRGGRRGGERIA